MKFWWIMLMPSLAMAAPSFFAPVFDATTHQEKTNSPYVIWGNASNVFNVKTPVDSSNAVPLGYFTNTLVVTNSFVTTNLFNDHTNMSLASGAHGGEKDSAFTNWLAGVSNSIIANSVTNMVLSYGTNYDSGVTNHILYLRLSTNASFSETDPIFSAWLPTNTYVKTETDPVFTNWLGTGVWYDVSSWITQYSNGIAVSSSYWNQAVSDSGSWTNWSKTWTNNLIATNAGAAGSGYYAMSNGVWTSFVPGAGSGTESDPIFTNWSKTNTVLDTASNQMSNLPEGFNIEWVGSGWTSSLTGTASNFVFTITGTNLFLQL